MQFKTPPVNELGLVVSTLPGLIDAFEIKDIHSRFRSRFPSVQRVAPAPGVQFALNNGILPLNMDPTVTRWWFVSDDDADLVQLQENMFARNWRRRTPFDQQPNYPGFDAVFNDFHRQLDVLSDWNSGCGRSMPIPTACELLYDDMIVVPADLTELTQVINFGPPGVKVTDTWQTNWAERLAVAEGNGRSGLQIAAFLGLADISGTGSLSPVVKLTWSAAAIVHSWGEVGSFFKTAHEYISERFGRLTTEEIRASWQE